MLYRTQDVTPEEVATAHFYRTDRQASIRYRERSICTVNEDSTGAWYLIRTEPGRDLTAMRNLARRRFGVFLPMKGLKRVVPGWLCAYVFDIEANQDRMLACPGVMGMLKVERTVGGKPVHMPVRLEIGFIRSLASEAWQGDVPPPRPKAERRSKAKGINGKGRTRLRRLKGALKKARKADNATRMLDIQAQITAFRQKHRPGDAAAVAV